VVLAFHITQKLVNCVIQLHNPRCCVLLWLPSLQLPPGEPEIMSVAWWAHIALRVVAAIVIAAGPQRAPATMTMAAAASDAAVVRRHLLGQAPHLAPVSTPHIAQAARTSTLTMAVHS